MIGAPSREESRAKFGPLYDQIATILFQADPIGINFGENVDEYEPEVTTILPRLSTASGPDDVAVIVYEEFVRWFGRIDAKGRARYVKPAAEIWQAWCRFNGREA